jgi:hypothetical protein
MAVTHKTLSSQCEASMTCGNEILGTYMQQIMTLSSPDADGRYDHLGKTYSDLMCYFNDVCNDAATWDTEDMLKWCASHAAFVTAIGMIGLSSEFIPAAHAESTSTSALSFSRFIGSFDESRARNECLGYLFQFRDFEGALH